MNLATIYETLGRLDDAEREFRRAIEIAPDRPGPHYGLGVVLERRGRIGEAIGSYREAARIDPSDPRPRSALERARGRASGADRDGSDPR